MQHSTSSPLINTVARTSQATSSVATSASLLFDEDYYEVFTSSTTVCLDTIRQNVIRRKVYLLRKLMAHPDQWQLTGWMEAITAQEETLCLALAAQETARMKISGSSFAIGGGGNASTRRGDAETMMLALAQMCVHQAQDELHATLAAAERYVRDDNEL
ncbi:hypothetical protein BC940DRAFT_321280 [Gongronella butleri]|nr:hypothetical protein BC940DRAFT_321280 [Gongronella butleri]